MTIIEPPLPTHPVTFGRVAGAPPSRRSSLDDVRALPAALRSEWLKLATVRANKAIFGLTLGINAFAAWAVAVSVKDEVLTVAQVFVFPTLLTAVLAAVAGILLLTSESQHGTLATALTAQPARWVLATSKAVTALAVGITLAGVGMVAAAGGALLGGLDVGDSTAFATTGGFALLFTSLAALIGLGLGLTVRHSAGSISGLLVWWFVVENLVRAFAPATVSRFLPFDAGYRMLEVGSEFDTPEILAAALTRPQLALVFTAYAVGAVMVGTVLLHRRDTN